MAVMETVAIGMTLLYFIRNRQKETLCEVPGIVALLLFLCYVLFQLVPLPPEIMRFLSPARFALHQETIAVFDPSAWIPVSINQKATLAEFFRLASYVSFYVLTVQLGSDKVFLKKIIPVVIIFAGSLSFLTILQLFLSDKKIYWFRAVQQNITPIGPYVCHNHYAGFMGMLLPLVVSMFFYYRPLIVYKKSFRRRLVEFFNQDRANIHLLLGFSALLMATSVFLSLSRGGIISLALTMLFLVGMLMWRGERKRENTILVFWVLLLLLVVSVGWFGWDTVFNRFARLINREGEFYEDRLVFWSDTIPIIKDFFLTGSGVGTFVNIYPRYSFYTAKSLVEHAHNDYLELVTDGGMIALFLVGWFIAVLIIKSFRTFLSRREPYSVHLVLGCLGGILYIFIHSVTDFNLRIGANGLYFFLLCGLVVSAAHTRLRGSPATILRRISFKGYGALPVLFSALIFLGSVYFNAGVIEAQIQFMSVVGNYRQANLHTPKDKLLTILDHSGKAIFFDPLEAEYHLAMAHTETLLGRDSDALSHYMTAVVRNPASGEFLQRLGLALATRNESEKAEKLLQAGIRYDQNNPSRYETYGYWLFSQYKMVQGLDAMKRAIELDQGHTLRYVTKMVSLGLDDEEIGLALPERVMPYLYFAGYLQNIGKEKMAEETYLKALEQIVHERAVRPTYFYKVYEYYSRKRRYEDALAVMQKALVSLPDDVGVRLTTASLYERLGITYRAIEEYKKVLVLDPGNKKAFGRLSQIMPEMK